jgi:hypothetical protein
MALGTVMTLFVLPGVLSLLLKAIGKGTSRASARPLEAGQLLRSQD